jgi:hypothetical protein
MIEYKTGDIVSEDAEALVNSVNCVEIMGRGVALQFKNAFPETSKPTSRGADVTNFSQAGCLSLERISFRTQNISLTSPLSSIGGVEVGFPTLRRALRPL